MNRGRPPGIESAMKLVWLFALQACYSPQFEPCSVRCALGVPCPDDGICGADFNCHVSASEPLCAPTEFTVTVHDTGSGTGGIVDDGGDFDCGASCEASFVEGSVFTLAATADPGSRFTTWDGADCVGTDPCMVTVNNDLVINAEFIRTFPLTVTFAGAGTGSVTSDPAGIDCLSDAVDCTALFDVGTIVTVASSPDNVFVGWTGACTGDTCVVTMDQAQQATATFE